MTNPHGHFVGWEAIARDSYTAVLFGATSTRTLTVHDLVVHVFGDTAVAEWTYEFDATRRAVGDAVHATGRDSMVFSRTADRAWKLVHVHYD